MSNLAQAARAYQAGASHRSMRAQQAEVFRIVNSALRSGREGGTIPRTRALADNRRLWTTVMNLMRDPANPLPAELRGSILSIGIAVQRDMDHNEPEFDFCKELRNR